MRSTLYTAKKMKTTNTSSYTDNEILNNFIDNYFKEQEELKLQRLQKGVRDEDVSSSLTESNNDSSGSGSGSSDNSGDDSSNSRKRHVSATVTLSEDGGAEGDGTATSTDGKRRCFVSVSFFFFGSYPRSFHWWWCSFLFLSMIACPMWFSPRFSFLIIITICRQQETATTLTNYSRVPMKQQTQRK